MYVFEVCVDNIESVRNAYNGGADRIELCSALSEGGLTPSLGLLKAARKATSPDFPIFVMIRPRGGNFVYDDAEVEIMEMDIRNLMEGGANGFVFGLLTAARKIDGKNCTRLLEIARPLPVTFHRAFDEMKSQKEQVEAVDAIVELGFTRLLTSGGDATAERGLGRILWLRERVGGRLVVMPGAGICPANLDAILRDCLPPVDFHGSAKGPSAEGLVVTSEAVVREMRVIADRFEQKQQSSSIAVDLCNKSSETASPSP